MQHFDRSMPPILRELNELEFDYADGEGIDFEPYLDFLSEEETRDWIRAWTGNRSLDGKEFLVFGQDGSGGYAAFWCVRPDAAVLEQPIVFLGSEGEIGVLAANFSDYLWLLAGGFGPSEALAYPDSERAAHQEFTAFAVLHSTSPKKTPRQVLASAQLEFPNFEKGIRSICG